MTRISSSIFTLRNHKGTIPQSPGFCSNFVWFSSHRLIVCYANSHQERALFFHGSEGGPESLWRQPFSLQSLPRRAWECSLPLGLLFIYFLLRIAEWAMAIVVGHERMTYLYRTWGRFRPKLTELNAGQIWESYRRPSRAGVSTSPPLTFGARCSIVGGGGACRVRGKVLSSISGLCPIDTSSTSPVMIAKNVSRYCLIKTSPVEYHWSGAIPVPHLADRKLSPAEGANLLRATATQLVQELRQEPKILTVHILRARELLSWALQIALLAFVSIFVLVPAPCLTPLSPASTL